MGFIARRIYNMGSSVAKKEMEHYRDFLKGMDSEELGTLLASAYHIGNNLNRNGWPIDDPLNYLDNPDLYTLDLTKSYSTLQNEECWNDAAALAIWIHTFRCADYGELRYIAKECWAELSRGRPYVEQFADAFFLMSGIEVNYSGYENFPNGFAPNG